MTYTELVLMVWLAGSKLLDELLLYKYIS